MANVSQQDIDAIVSIQINITPKYHIINEVQPEQVEQWLQGLSYMQNVSKAHLADYIVKEKNRIIGVDCVRLLKKQYDVSDAAQLMFKNIKLGGALLKDARAVVFDHCDFTSCHVAKDDTNAFIKTNNDDMNDFTRARFLSCDLHEVLFKNVTLNQAYFANTKLSATQFLYSDLASCDFESITFSRMPRFVHSNLYQSHAHLHTQDLENNGRLYQKAALLGGILISASALLITLMMFDVIHDTTAMGALSVGLLMSGIVLGYLGAASSNRQQNIANRYALFEQTVDTNAQNNRQVLEEREKIRAQANQAGKRW